MESEITNYLLSTRKDMNIMVAKTLTKKLCKYNDIGDEFLQWVKTHSYDFEQPVTSKGYTAKQISEMAPFMSGVGVYNFMVSLRDNPDFAQQCIDEGFIIM